MSHHHSYGKNGPAPKISPILKAQLENKIDDLVTCNICKVKFDTIGEFSYHNKQQHAG